MPKDNTPKRDRKGTKDVVGYVYVLDADPMPEVWTDDIIIEVEPVHIKKRMYTDLKAHKAENEQIIAAAQAELEQEIENQKQKHPGKAVCGRLNFGIGLSAENV